MKNVKCNRVSMRRLVMAGCLLLAIVHSSKAQINYTQDFSSGNAGWANSNPSSVVSNLTQCNNPGGLGTRVFSAIPSGNLTSPDLGGVANNGGNLTLSYQYKLVDYGSSTYIRATANDMMIVEVQYATSVSGPWTTLQKIVKNHVPTMSCTNKTITFPVSAAGTPVFIRFACSRQSASADCSVIVDDISLTQGGAPAGTCSGTPLVGVTLASNLTVCNTTGGATELSLASLPVDGSAVTYQWQSSPDGNGYADLSGATSISFYTDTISSDTWFRCRVTCVASGQSANSAPVQIKALPCSFAVSRDSGVAFNSIRNIGTYLPAASPLAPVGFPFVFMGNTYTQIQFSATGSLSFAANIGADPNGVNPGFLNNINSTNFSPSLLLPFWEDMLQMQEMRYQTEGVAPNRIFTAEWIGANYGLGNYTVSNLDLNFQVRLYEGSNKIEYLYGNMDGHKRISTGITTYTSGSHSFSVGLRNTAANFIGQKVSNSDYFVTTLPNDTLSILPLCGSRLTFIPANVLSAGTAPGAVTPANDNSSGAIVLPVNDGPCSSFCGSYYSTANATPSPEGSTCTIAPDDDVWFKFTLASATNINIKIVRSDQYIPVVSLTDAAFTSVPGYGCTVMGSGNENISVAALPAGSYYIRVSNFGSGSGPEGQFAICVSKPPANDECSGALPLTVNNGFNTSPVLRSMVNGSVSVVSASGPACSFSGNLKDVWFSLQVPVSGNVVIQLDAADEAGSSGNYNLQAFTGTCGNLTGVGCSSAGDLIEQGSTNMPRLVLTGQTPGSNILVLVQSRTNFQESFWIGAYDTSAVSSPQVAAGGACTGPGNKTIISGINHNKYLKQFILDASGNIIAAVYPNGYALGWINTSVNVNAGSVRQSSIGYYLDRNITISPELQPSPSGPPMVTLYYKQSELDVLAAANSGNPGTGVNVSKNNDLCSNAMVNVPSALTTTNGKFAHGRFAQVTVPSFSTFYMIQTTPLPVTLVAFSGKNAGLVNRLSWTTAMEQNFSHFELQRASDGIAFSSIATLKSLGDNGGNYSYIDQKPYEGLNFYRLNMIDRDGTSVLSTNVVTLNVKHGNSITLSAYPNPVKGQLNVDITGTVSGTGSLQVLDIMGKVVRDVTVTRAANQIDMAGLASGTYILRYRDNNNNIVMKVSRK